jgi:hypothetical protein
LKTYKYSIIYAIFLGIVNLFHFRIERWILKVSGRNFAFYLIVVLFLVFFLVVFLKKRSKITNPEVAVLLLTMGFVFFLLISRTVYLFQLGVLEMFILGILLAAEGRKTKNLYPFLILAGAAILVEIASSLSIGSSFYYLDAWRNALVALSGYLAASLLIR